MKTMRIFFGLALTAVLAGSLTGCMPGITVTSPKDEAFQKDWADSMEEIAEDWTQDWESAVDEAVESWSGRDENGVEKDHYWKIIDVSDEESAIVEVGTVTDGEQVKVLDDLLSDDDGWGVLTAEDPGEPAYSYIYCQQETLKAGQDPADRDYEELVRFTVSADADIVTMVILEDLPSLMGVDLEDVLTFTVDVPAETAEALRDPARFTD